MSTSPFAPDPERRWTRRNYDDSKSSKLPRRERSEIETGRDLEKPVEQLLSDIHEESHDPNRTELQNIAGAQKRIASMMARVSKANDRVANQMLYLTWAISVMTLVILVFTVLVWKDSQKEPQKAQEQRLMAPSIPGPAMPNKAQEPMPSGQSK